MDPIIRAARVSPVARRVGRPAPATAPASARTHGVAPDPVRSMEPLAAPSVPVQAALPAAAPTTVPAAPARPVAAVQAAAPAVAVTPAASPVPAAAPVEPVDKRDYAAELAQAVAAHKAALQQRDTEIDSLRKAAQEAALALTDAYTDAEERGYAAGEKKGSQAAQAALQKQIERATSLAAEIGKARDALMEDAEDALVGIVFAALCRILGEQGATRETVASVVRETIASTREREQLVVRLHPDDAALFTGAQDDGADMRFKADPSIKLGGCIVDGKNGSLDARFETQLGLLAAALKQVRASRLAGQDAA